MLVTKVEYTLEKPKEGVIFKFKIVIIILQILFGKLIYHK